VDASGSVTAHGYWQRGLDLAGDDVANPLDVEVQVDVPVTAAVKQRQLVELGWKSSFDPTR
jgi:hypothetical protein